MCRRGCLILAARSRAPTTTSPSVPWNLRERNGHANVRRGRCMGKNAPRNKKAMKGASQFRQLSQNRCRFWMISIIALLRRLAIISWQSRSPSTSTASGCAWTRNSRVCAGTRSRMCIKTSIVYQQSRGVPSPTSQLTKTASLHPVLSRLRRVIWLPTSTSARATACASSIQNMPIRRQISMISKSWMINTLRSAP